MSTTTGIEWTDATWNPVTGCTKVSPACAHCYIERTPPFRIGGRKFVRGHIPLEFHEERLDGPLRRRTPTVYFVNSLSDLFHPDIPEEFLNRVYSSMEQANWHTFQVLTKRADRMRDYLSSRYGESAPPRHLWHGISAENQRALSDRWPHLRETPTAVRFISAEPLLTPLCLDGCLPLIDWVIVGGESGPNRRRTDPDWVREVRDQCIAAGVAFFFKQWGGRTPKALGRELDGRTWDQMPRTMRDATTVV